MSNTANHLFGRAMILHDDVEITDKNVVDVLEKVIPLHEKNRREIQYLYDYFKGKQPA